MFLKEANEITGGLSNPSKMPGYGYSLPAAACRTGSRLRKKKGTVCSLCYARKGRYSFRNVREALQRRLGSLKDPKWADAMAFSINYRKNQGHRYFRWHDSGDLQGTRHLRKIFEVCRKTPGVTHWLPTKEFATVKQVLKKDVKPDNLVIRLSGHLINQPPVEQTNTLVSSVHTDEAEVPDAKICQAVKQRKPCGRCRACWNPDIKHVSYGVH